MCSLLRGFAGAMVFLLLASAGARAAEPLRIVVLGDSTVCDYPEKAPTRGWGQYLAEGFREVKTVPILVTPMHRRVFRDGKPAGELRPYAEAMKAVAQEKEVKLVDLFTSSGALFARLGDAGSADLSSSATDRTHFSEK